jgi:hypothetical protein
MVEELRGKRVPSTENVKKWLERNRFLKRPKFDNRL